MNSPDLTASLLTLAGWLEYPARQFAGAYPIALVPESGRFLAALNALGQAEREELYTATFDVSPACVLYVSVHLFGEENFKRGEFMAALQARYRQLGFDAEGELPDHLAVLLRFTARVDEPERRELVEYCLLGPVAHMIAELAEANPYRALLEAVRETLQSAYPGLRPSPSPREQMARQGGTGPALAAGCQCGGAYPHESPPDTTPGNCAWTAPAESGRSHARELAAPL